MPCPGFNVCKATCGHKQLLSDYYLEREAQALRVEAVAIGYATETADYYRDVEPRWTFQRHLLAYKGRNDERPDEREDSPGAGIAAVRCGEEAGSYRPAYQNA